MFSAVKVNMNPLNLITDGYERKARLYPALVLLAPVVVTIIATMGAKLSALQSLGAAVAAGGGAFLLSQLARDAGKSREKRLFSKWGGLPSVAIFRHRDTRLDSVTKARYHKKLSTLVKGIKAPSPQDEQADPVKADEVYTAWSTFLRVNTRDTKKYPLLFQENINYGYRRNLWGLRPLGIISCVLACLINGILFYRELQTTGKFQEEFVGVFSFSFVFLLLWAFRFASDWVRIPADAYAERLVETVEIIGAKTAAAKK